MARVKANIDANYLNLYKTALDQDVGNGITLSLQWGFRNKYPRLTVYLTENGISKIDGLIIAPFVNKSLFTFIGFFEDIVDEEPNTVLELPCYNYLYDNDGKKSAEPAIQAMVGITKRADSTYYMTLKSDAPLKFKKGDAESEANAKRYRAILNDAKFELSPDLKWHKFFKNGKEVTDKGFLSAKTTKGYFKAIAEVLVQYGEFSGLLSKVMYSKSGIGHVTVTKPNTSNNKELSLDDL